MRIMLALSGALVLMAAIPAVAAAQPAPASAAHELTAGQWRQDLRFMVAEMEQRHPNLYHQVSRDAFQAAVADLDSRIPNLQRHQIIVGMMRIVAMVGDGHTRIEPRKDPAFRFPSLPVKLYLFDDGLYVRAAAPGQAKLIGARVEAIGGVPVAEAIRRAGELASRENSIGQLLYVPLYLAMPDVLHALGLSDSRMSSTLTLTLGNRRWAETVAAGAVEPRWPPDTDISLITPEGWTDARTGARPLWLQAPLDYHRLIELGDRNALYAQLNMVTNIDGETLAQFGERILGQSRRLNPRVVVLDLRLNQGGNGDLRHDFIRSLIKAEDQDTRLAVLTARGTFSASQFILNDLDRLTEAAFVGEPAGSRPTHYGDSYRSTLPNSGITLRTSIKYWQSEQDMREWTPVDIAAPLRFADYVAGRDPALEAALGAIPPPLSERFIAAAKSAEPTSVAAAMDKVRSDPVNRYADTERMAIRATMALSREDGQGQRSLAAARWTARQFPKSAMAATILGMVAEANAEPAEALEAVQAAVALDPNDRTARSLLERLAAK